MKRLIAFTFVLFVFSSPSFSQGGIYLFADSTSFGVSSDIGQYDLVDIYLAYSSDYGQGPDGITGLEFMVQWESDLLVGPTLSTFYPHIVVNWMGDVRSGITICLLGCHGEGMDYLFFGHFTVTALGPIVSGSETVVLSIVSSPTCLKQEPIVSDCEPIGDREDHVVDGYKFVFPFDAFVLGNEPASWGAIKAMMK